MLLRKEMKFFKLYNQQCENMVAAAKFFNELVTTGNFNEDSVAAMRRFEQEGDIITREVSMVLNKTFITPFDREDIFELSNEIDNVVDSIDALTKRMRLYKLTKPDPLLKQFAVLIEQSAIALSDAVKYLDNAKNYSRVQIYCSEVNRLENLGDQLRDTSIGDLLDNNTDPIYVIKWKEIYETAEATIDICDRVGKTLYSITVKNN
jgi:predicted phosphate transport protein (TIGR00153 family)